MKKPLLFIFTLLSTGLYAQEHFSGINTSQRTGVLNAAINPAELTNLKNKFEVNVLNFSINASNNKVSIGDLFQSDTDFEEIIFSGDEPVNMTVDLEILGPSLAFKYENWAFAFTTAAKLKSDIVDVDTGLGRALTTESDALSIVNEYINTDYNQRVSGTSWGEIGFSVARDIYETDVHKFSGGVTFKLLFPGSYANIAADKFTGTIQLGTGINTGDVVMTNASTQLNLAYSGSLADGFDSSNFTNFFAGGLNGFSTDIGINYRWKDVNSDDGEYRVNAGISIRNLGSMTFNDDNNESTNYKLEVTGSEEFNLSQFEGADGFDEIEAILNDPANSAYVTAEEPSSDFKIKTPATLSMYADVKLLLNFHITGFLQQKLNESNDNNRIAAQNVFTITPRYSGKLFEVFAPLSSTEISGFTAGLGFRIGGFYIGSGSVVTAIVSDAKQADAYLGFRFGF